MVTRLFLFYTLAQFLAWVNKKGKQSDTVPTTPKKLSQHHQSFAPNMIGLDSDWIGLDYGNNCYHLISIDCKCYQNKIKEMDFADKWAAFDWMYKKQLGRRNLTDEQKTYLLGKLYEARKKTQGTNNQYVQAKSEKAQNEPFHKENKTAATIAKEQGVGTETVKRAEKFSKGVDAIRFGFFSYC